MEHEIELTERKFLEELIINAENTHKILNGGEQKPELIALKDVELLAFLTKEESHRMPSGLDRSSRKEWAKTVLDDIKKQDKTPIVSDGKSSSYYDLKLSQKTIDFIVENGYVKTEHLIYDIFDNDFDFGNAFKSLVRAWGSVRGKGKYGNSLEYELNKIEYSINKIREYRGKE